MQKILSLIENFNFIKIEFNTSNPITSSGKIIVQNNSIETQTKKSINIKKAKGK